MHATRRGTKSEFVTAKIPHWREIRCFLCSGYRVANPPPGPADESGPPPLFRHISNTRLAMKQLCRAWIRSSQFEWENIILCSSLSRLPAEPSKQIPNTEACVQSHTSSPPHHACHLPYQNTRPRLDGAISTTPYPANTTPGSPSSPSIASSTQICRLTSRTSSQALQSGKRRCIGAAFSKPLSRCWPIFPQHAGRWIKLSNTSRQ